MAKKVYGIDLDGVCFDFVNAFRKWLNVKLHKHLAEDEITSYYWHECTDITKAEFFKEFDNFGMKGHGYLDLELLPGTLEALNAIHEAGHQIVYITNRPPYAMKDTEMALERHKFPQRGNLHCARGSKLPMLEKFNVDVFIDDSPKTIEQLSTGSRAQIYCRSYAFNEHLDDNNGKWFRRVSNWEQFLDYEGF